MEATFQMAPGQPAAAEAERGVDAPATFPELVRTHQSMVFSIALHFLRDREAAEEVAQDVFLQLYRSLKDLESGAHVTNWLRRVTSNRCIDYSRRRKLRAAVALEDAPEPATRDEHGDPILNRKLRQLVATLPERARMVVLLRYQEDLTPEEIAKVVDAPVRTVKSHLTRSLALLREKVGRSLGDIRRGEVR